MMEYEKREKRKLLGKCGAKSELTREVKERNIESQGKKSLVILEKGKMKKVEFNGAKGKMKLRERAGEKDERRDDEEAEEIGVEG